MNSIALKTALAGKRILFIGVKFYHYNAEIIKKMEQYGAAVRFFYERDISVKHAIIDNFFNSYIDVWQKRHYDNILKRIKNEHYDYLLVIRGYKMEGSFVDKVRNLNAGIKTIMYQWDSRKNWNYEDIIPYFDLTRSFDYKDSKDLRIKYVPTFHTDEISQMPKVKAKYKLFFYGNFTSERYFRMIELMNYANRHTISLKTHLHISWKRFLIERLKGLQIKAGYIAFSRMDKKKYLSLFNESEIVVDITTDAQTGLAMRVIDALGAGKKVITNNRNVVKEPTYSPDQFLIIDLENLNIPIAFLQCREFKKQDYSIDRWLENIFID